MLKDLLAGSIRIVQANFSVEGTTSRTTNSTSVHRLPSSVTFQSLEATHQRLVELTEPKVDGERRDANSDVEEYGCTTYLSMQQKDLTLSTRFWSKKTASDLPVQDSGSKKRKRVLDTEAATCVKVQKAVEKLKSSGSFSQDELTIAEAVLTRSVQTLRGANGEVAVQSFALVPKKLAVAERELQAVPDSIVIAMRLNSGVAVPLDALKAVLGMCWKDGVLTSQDECCGVSAKDIPHTELGTAAMEHGNHPMLLVTSVPKQ
jgi:hypothetical protein